MAKYPITRLDGSPLSVEVESHTGETLTLTGFRDRQGVWLTAKGYEDARGISKDTVRRRAKKTGRIRMRTLKVLIRKGRGFGTHKEDRDFFLVADEHPSGGDDMLAVAEIARKLGRHYSDVYNVVVRDAEVDSEIRDCEAPDGSLHTSPHARLEDVRMKLSKRSDHKWPGCVKAPPGRMTLAECEEKSPWTRKAWDDWSTPRKQGGHGCPWLKGRVIKRKKHRGVWTITTDDYERVMKAHRSFSDASEQKTTVRDAAVEHKKTERFIRRRIARRKPGAGTNSWRTAQRDAFRPDLLDDQDVVEALNDDVQQNGELTFREAAQRFGCSRWKIRTSMQEYAPDAIRELGPGPKTGAKVAPIEAYEASLRGEHWTPPQTNGNGEPPKRDRAELPETTMRVEAESPPAPRPKKRKGGRPPKWDHVVMWFRQQKRSQPNLKMRAALREYAEAFPDRPCPDYETFKKAVQARRRKPTQ